MEKLENLPVDEELVHEVIVLLRDLLHVFLMSSVPAWIDLQLTLPQLRTLFIIAHNKTSSIIQISQHLGIGEPTTSHQVDKLVQAGLVERKEDPQDRRRLLVTLSAPGMKLIEKLLGWEGLLDELFSSASKEDISHLHQGLKALMFAYQNRTLPHLLTKQSEEAAK